MREQLAISAGRVLELPSRVCESFTYSVQTQNLGQTRYYIEGIRLVRLLASNVTRSSGPTRSDPRHL